MSETASRLVGTRAPGRLLGVALAPITVIAFHHWTWTVGLGDALNGAVHFLGGASMAAFLGTASRLAWPGEETRERLARASTALGMTAVIAIGWEAAEYLYTRWIGWGALMTLEDTIGDLVLGVAGATLGVGLAVAIGLALRPAPSRRPTPPTSAM